MSDRITAMILVLLLAGCAPVQLAWPSHLRAPAQRPLPALPEVALQEVRGQDVTLIVKNTTSIPLTYLSVCGTAVQRFSEVWDGSKWVESDWDWCGTGLRFNRIAPGSAAELVIQKMHKDKRERLHTVLSHADEPELRSLVLLYEEPANPSVQRTRGVTLTATKEDREEAGEGGQW